jgi:hypothetical protein
MAIAHASNIVTSIRDMIALNPAAGKKLTNVTIAAIATVHLTAPLG